MKTPLRSPDDHRPYPTTWREGVSFLIASAGVLASTQMKTAKGTFFVLYGSLLAAAAITRPPERR